MTLHVGSMAAVWIFAGIGVAVVVALIVAVVLVLTCFHD